MYFSGREEGFKIPTADFESPRYKDADPFFRSAASCCQALNPGDLKKIVELFSKKSSIFGFFA